MKEPTKEGLVSHIASYPPIFFLLAIVLGLLIDRVFFWPLNYPWLETLGVIFIILAPLFIFWAQRSSYFAFKTKRVTDVKEEDFHRGPYHFLRHPTYLGLFCLVLGFGFLNHSPSIIVLSIIAFLIVHFYVLPHEEGILIKKYGEEYLNYKKRVRPWFF